jgi:hypothetical protein
MRSPRLRSLLAVACVALVSVALPVAAHADDGNDVDIRVERSCSLRSTIELRVRTEDGTSTSSARGRTRRRSADQLLVEVEVETPRRRGRWSVVLVHERRIALRTTRRPDRSSRSFSLTTTIPDWPGRDTVTVRAIGPRGEICRASATILVG